MNHFQTSVFVRRYRNQRGSALLVVLVFAAIIAIMLYRELPIAAFEAQRQREQLTVSRGNEYKRGVKLFVRKVGRFPNSLEELENTNRMRFLRHRYVDPLTGKDDWRLIHAGPGGVIIDSKVKNSSTQAAGPNALGQGAVFAGFNNAFSGDQAAVAEAGPPSAALRQRAAATKNAASVQVDSSGLPTMISDGSGNEISSAPPSNTDPGAQGTGSQAIDPVTGQPITNNNPGATTAPTNLPGQVAASQPNNPIPNGPAATNGADPNALAGNGISSVAQQLNNVNPRTPEQAQAGQGQAFGNNGQQNMRGMGNGQIGGAGGIAGVASKAEGKSIKTVNDQTKYSLWEFYYDLRKDQTGGAGVMPQNVNNGINTNNGVNNNGAINSGGFGSNNGIGQNNGSAFGPSQTGLGSTMTQQPPPTPIPQPQQQQ